MERQAGRAFQAEVKAGTKALRWDQAWLMRRLERKQMARLWWVRGRVVEDEGGKAGRGPAR